MSAITARDEVKGCLLHCSSSRAVVAELLEQPSRRSMRGTNGAKRIAGGGARTDSMISMRIASLVIGILSVCTEEQRALTLCDDRWISWVQRIRSSRGLSGQGKAYDWWTISP